MKKEKEEIKAKAYTTLLKENEKLNMDIKALRKSGEEMGNEIKSLRSSVGSYKAANTRMKNELEKLKAYAREADELNESKAGRILELEKQLELAENNTAVAQDATKSAQENVIRVCQANKDLSDEIDALNANIEWYNSLPWYRKIFVNKI